MRYLTDGTCLYELVTEQRVQNAGLRHGALESLIVMDCLTLEMLKLREPALADIRPVVPTDGDAGA